MFLFVFRVGFAAVARRVLLLALLSSILAVEKDADLDTVVVGVEEREVVL